MGTPSYASPTSTKAKVDRLEQQLAQTMSRMEEMQNQLNKLQGKSEVLGFEIQELRQQAQNQNQDLDGRLREIENVQLSDGPGPAAMPSRPTTTAMPTANISNTTSPVSTASRNDAVAIETTIEQMFRDKSWNQSIVQLEGWIENHDKHPKRADVMLALGQAYYEKKDYPRAIQALQSVVDEFPPSGQACEARYYQGQSFIGLEDSKNAALFFQEAIELCPKHPAKEKAQKALQSINA